MADDAVAGPLRDTLASPAGVLGCVSFSFFFFFKWHSYTAIYAVGVSVTRWRVALQLAPRSALRGSLPTAQKTKDPLDEIRS